MSGHWRADQDSIKRTVQDILESGKDLIQVKPILSGNFEAWFELETGLDRQMAYKFIQAAEKFGDGMYNNYTSLSPTVLYLISAPSTPETVVTQAIEKAESGEKVTVADVKEWKQRCEEFRKESNDRRLKIRDLEAKIDLLSGQLADAKPEIIEKLPDDYEELKKRSAEAQAELETIALTRRPNNWVRSRQRSSCVTFYRILENSNIKG
ncbi:MAG: hypothetical protein IPN66_07255 [Candidatus Competibacteraceae bacterium]|nr:hypothetical protein [Candidatus Competibacteraceae bacterium]